MRKTIKAQAAFVANVPAVIDPAVAFRELSRSEQMAQLSAADAKHRMVLLSYLGVGQLASLAGDAMRIGSSIYEAIHLKLVSVYGKDWHRIVSTPARDLNDADKARKPLIAKDIEAIRDGVKAANGGDAQKASDAIRAIKDWGSGKRQSKSNPKANTKAETRKWLMAWDVLPAMYRRLMADDDIQEAEQDLADAIAAYFKTREVNEAHIRELKGKSDYVAPLN